MRLSNLTILTLSLLLLLSSCQSSRPAFYFGFRPAGVVAPAVAPASAPDSALAAAPPASSSPVPAAGPPAVRRPAVVGRAHGRPASQPLALRSILQQGDATAAGRPETGRYRSVSVRLGQLIKPKNAAEHPATRQRLKDDSDSLVNTVIWLMISGVALFVGYIGLLIGPVWLFFLGIAVAVIIIAVVVARI